VFPISVSLSGMLRDAGFCLLVLRVRHSSACIWIIIIVAADKTRYETIAQLGQKARVDEVEVSPDGFTQMSSQTHIFCVRACLKRFENPALQSVFAGRMFSNYEILVHRTTNRYRALLNRKRRTFNIWVFSVNHQVTNSFFSSGRFRLAI